jgi:hypothetical protein
MAYIMASATSIFKPTSTSLHSVSIGVFIRSMPSALCLESLVTSPPRLTQNFTQEIANILHIVVVGEKWIGTVSSSIHPNDKLQVFVLPDDYSFGIIQSSLHWIWFTEKCTTLKGDPNYNAESIWFTFPWPQSPSLAEAKQVAEAAVNLRQLGAVAK